MDLKSVISSEGRIRKANRRKMQRERKKRRAQRFGQMELKHARRGTISCMLALCSVFLLVLTFSVSYGSRGEVGLFIGILGLAALAMSVVGLLRGIEGFKERNKNYLSCKVGVAGNAVLILMFASMFIRGLF